jgi:hypothetical protein
MLPASIGRNNRIAFARRKRRKRGEKPTFSTPGPVLRADQGEGFGNIDVIGDRDEGITMQWTKWIQRMTVIVLIASIPVSAGDFEVERLHESFDAAQCADSVRPVDRSRTLEEIRQAYAWNDLLVVPLQAINHEYFSPDQVLTLVDSWLPMITCIAAEFEIPPDLLAGLLALEIDLDYHTTDAIVDNLLQSPLGDLLSRVEIGAGYAGAHFKHLRPALASFGPHFSESAFYRQYYQLIMSRRAYEFRQLATQHRLIDIANAAVMARYYALLRMGNRPQHSMTITDMAFVWSAYRGGVVGTPADPGDDYRWSVAYLQQADNPHVFGDTIIAFPYFSYYQACCGRMGDNGARINRLNYSHRLPLSLNPSPTQAGRGTCTANLTPLSHRLRGGKGSGDRS